MTKSKKIILIITSIVLVLLIAGGIFYNYLKTPRFDTEIHDLQGNIEHIVFKNSNDMLPVLNSGLSKADNDLKKNDELLAASNYFDTNNYYLSRVNNITYRMEKLFEVFYKTGSEVKAEVITKSKYVYSVHYKGFGIRRDGGAKEPIDFVVVHNIEPVKYGGSAEATFVPNGDDRFLEKYSTYKYDVERLYNEFTEDLEKKSAE